MVPGGELGAGKNNKVPSVAVLVYPHKWGYDLKRVNITDCPHPSNSRVYKQKSLEMQLRTGWSLVGSESEQTERVKQTVWDAASTVGKYSSSCARQSLGCILSKKCKSVLV